MLFQMTAGKVSGLILTMSCKDEKLEKEKGKLLDVREGMC